MLRNIKDVIGCRLAARDGEIGRVKDFYFEDANWVVRYLVADTGNWMPGRRVLVSPYAIRHIDGGSGKLVGVDLTKDQIRQQPSVEADKPISRQMEEQFYRYYDWPFYWAGPYIWGPNSLPRADAMPATVETPADRAESQAGRSHLRSAMEVRGYHIQALDDQFGHIEDFIFDDEAWVIRYLLVDTRNWWPGRGVLLPPDWISSIDWDQSRVNVDLDRQTVRRAPRYDPDKPLSRQYEEQLFAFYNRQPYWRRRAETAHTG